MSDETKQKISMTLKGKCFSKEHRKKLSMNHWAKTDDGKRSISERLKGHKVSNETREKMSISQKDKKYKPETIEKMKKAHYKKDRVYPSQIKVCCLFCKKIFRQTTIKRHVCA